MPSTTIQGQRTRAPRPAVDQEEDRIATAAAVAVTAGPQAREAVEQKAVSARMQGRWRLAARLFQVVANAMPRGPHGHADASIQRVEHSAHLCRCMCREARMRTRRVSAVVVAQQPLSEVA